MQDVWVEKYRPRRLSEVINQKNIVERLSSYAKTRSMPHMMFAGPAGSGKTTCAIALARELYGEFWRDNLIELNASDERGIDVVRGKVKDFARAASIGMTDFKIIFLDEADSLTSDAQAALRRTITVYPDVQVHPFVQLLVQDNRADTVTLRGVQVPPVERVRRAIVPEEDRHSGEREDRR